jgi:hypothetical protein
MENEELLNEGGGGNGVWKGWPFYWPFLKMMK